MFGTITETFGGKSRVLKFNLNCNYEFCKLHGLKQDDVLPFLANGLNVTAVRDMIYCAVKVADLEAGRTVDYNQYTVGEWIQEMEQAQLERIILGTADANPPDNGKKKAKAR